MTVTLGQRAARASRLVTALVAGAVLAATPPNGFAQAPGGTVAGRVTDDRSGAPLALVTVIVEGTRLGAITGEDGRFRVTGVTAGAHVIIARRVGYTAGRQNTTVSDGQQANVDFGLHPAVVSLDQVVVTGTAGRETRRSIGNAVATIDADDALSKSAAPDLSSLLSARTAGVVVTQGSGRLGAGPAIQIRGRSSIGLGNSPLIYIDGVRVNNTINTGPAAVPGGLAGQGSAVAGRLNDIPPEDIQSIEVIKGPAASTIYGTEASNGVIQIITKRGAVGARPQFSLDVQGGSIWFRDAESRMPTNYDKDSTGAIIAWNAITQENARGTPLFKTGRSSQYSASLSGGQNAIRYYASSAYEDDRGIEPNNSLRQFSVHANLDVAPNALFDAATSINYVNLRNHLGVDFGASAMLAAQYGHILLFPKARGFGLNFPPEVTQQLWDNFQNVSRFTLSERLQHLPFPWFGQRLTLGLDYTGDDSRSLERFAPPDLAAILTASTAAGRIGQTLRNITGITADYSGTATFQLRPSLTSATSVGGQLFRNESNASFLGGTGFPGPGIETVSGAAQVVTPSQTQILNTTIGAFAQEKLAWRDRLFLTGAVRVDNNSAFGEDFKWVTYPKVDASWVVSEEPFWHWGSVVSSFRLRAAYGESGRQPATFSALRTFTPVQGPGGTNAVTPGSIGNPDLRPERGKELEAGFEATVNRLTLDFTYFNKRTDDEIINQPVAPSSGFAGSRPVNLGRVDNHGIELLATLQAVARSNFEWEIRGTVATSHDEIKDLGGGGTGAIASAGQSNRVGHPIGGIFTKVVVSADRDPVTSKAINPMCNGGPGKPPIACAQAPFLFIGTPTPKTTGAVANTFTVNKKLRLFALVDFKRGHRIFNANELLRCTGALGAGLCEANWRPEKYPTVYLAETVGTASNQGIVDQYYQDGSFAKLREISASYSLPHRFIPGATAATLTVAARELRTWTNYRSVDPEVNANGGASATTQDQALYPPLSRLVATLNIRF